LKALPGVCSHVPMNSRVVGRLVSGFCSLVIGVAGSWWVVRAFDAEGNWRSWEVAGPAGLVALALTAVASFFGDRFLRRPVENGWGNVLEQMRRRSYNSVGDISTDGDLRQIELALTPKAQFVGSGTVGSRLKPKGSIVDTFDDAGGRLVLLGSPGAGKTIGSYTISEHLDVSTEYADPIFVDLAAWNHKDVTSANGDEPFKEFLVSYLCDRVRGYGVGDPEQAADWIGSYDNYALVLDGLDEIESVSARVACFQSLSLFVMGAPTNFSVLLTCRTDEYSEILSKLDERPSWLRAAELAPLDDDQIAEICQHLSDPAWVPILSAKTEASASIREALRSPLIASLSLEAELPPDRLLSAATSGSVEHRKERVASTVVEAYVETTIATHPDPVSTLDILQRVMRGRSEHHPITLAKRHPAHPGHRLFNLDVAMLVVSPLVAVLLFALHTSTLNVVVAAVTGAVALVCLTTVDDEVVPMSQVMATWLAAFSAVAVTANVFETSRPLFWIALFATAPAVLLTIMERQRERTGAPALDWSVATEAIRGMSFRYLVGVILLWPFSSAIMVSAVLQPIEIDRFSDNLVFVCVAVFVGLVAPAVRSGLRRLGFDDSISRPPQAEPSTIEFRVVRSAPVSAFELIATMLTGVLVLTVAYAIEHSVQFAISALVMTVAAGFLGAASQTTHAFVADARQPNRNSFASAAISAVVMAFVTFIVAVQLTDFPSSLMIAATMGGVSAYDHGGRFLVRQRAHIKQLVAPGTSSLGRQLPPSAEAEEQRPLVN